MKFSFGSSFNMAAHVLSPVVLLESIELKEGEPERPIVLRPDLTEATLTVQLPTIDVTRVLEECELSSSSGIMLQVDLDCPGFDLVEPLLSRVLPSSGKFSLPREAIAVVPRSVVVQGFAVKVSLIAARPVPSGKRGCSIPGGVLCSWVTKVPSRNRASMFPLQDSVEPALWRLEIDIDEPDDLERPLRSALRLFVDSSKLEHLLGNAALAEVQEQAIRWLQAESFTSIVAHVVANEELRNYLAGWLSVRPPIEKTLDPKSVGFFIVQVLRRSGVTDLATLRRQLESRPSDALNEIRSRVAHPVERKGVAKHKRKGAA